MTTEHLVKKRGGNFVVLLVGFFRHRSDRSFIELGHEFFALPRHALAIISIDIIQTTLQEPSYALSDQKVRDPALLRPVDGKIRG